MRESSPLVGGLSGVKLVRGTLKDEAISVVRRALMAGEMEPGKIYSANSLAVQLGVSNSPVREAMMALSAKGLLEVVRNRGFRVVEMTVQDQLEVYDLRLLVEVPSIGRLAEMSIAQPDAARLRDLAQATVTKADPHNMLEFLESDQHFHLSLIEMLNNRRLLAIIENLRDQSRINDTYRLLEHGRLQHSAVEHGLILDAILAGNRPLAERLMTEHLDYSKP
ncbi:GntR family transcriptional regulator [Cryobacterium sp. MLB-32]|uniref:GntR family transcriptional regulator n=1 Tax=Cryobacterium sp. MLB-32 TaxID=1529318 RepID=UPI00068D820D|nr:GntR family transcriptional regulator [Cryobacterium sp. MLB-32]